MSKDDKIPKSPSVFESPPGSCPTPEELGRAGWSILHTSAATFPNHPTPEQSSYFRNFIISWANVYACSHCAYHMRRALEKYPPVTTNKREASRYICFLHNKVNHLLNKPEYDCHPDVVLKRWHPTYPNMEDMPSIEDQIKASQLEEAKRKNVTPSTTSQNVTTTAAKNEGPPTKTSGGFSMFGFGSSKQEKNPPNNRWTGVTNWRESAPLSSGGNYSNVTKTTSQNVKSADPSSDDEDIDAILKRLKGCQVYCPEKKL